MSVLSPQGDRNTTNIEAGQIGQLLVELCLCVSVTRQVPMYALDMVRFCHVLFLYLQTEGPTSLQNS